MALPLAPHGRRALPAFLALAALYSVSAFLILHPTLTRSPHVALGVTVDLTLTAAALTYFLGVRRAGLPRRTPLLVAGLGAGLAALFVPGALALLATAWIGVEAVLAALAFVRLRRITRAVRARPAGTPLLDALEDAVPSRFAHFLIGELTAVFHTTTGWFRRAEPGWHTLHRVRSWNVLAATIGFLVLIEAFVVHVFLAAAVHAVAAWLVTALSLYALVYLAGDAHALRLGGLRLTDDQVDLRLGLRYRARGQLAEISATPLPDAVDLALLGPANVYLRFAAPIKLRGLLGRGREVSAIALFVDRPEDLPT